MTLVSYAEFVWGRIDKGYSLQKIADVLGWSKGGVANYAQLNKIAKPAWETVFTTFEGSSNSASDGVVNESFTTVNDSPFTEGLLRSILGLEDDCHQMIS